VDAGGFKQVQCKEYICEIQVKIHISDQTSLRICNSEFGRYELPLISESAEVPIPSQAVTALETKFQFLNTANRTHGVINFVQLKGIAS
jgi:hypothetical protein